MEFNMNGFNDILPKLIKHFPTIVSKKTIESLLLLDKNALSYDSAASCITELDSAKEMNKTHSSEATQGIDRSDAGDYQTKKEDDFVLANSVRSHFANVKFDSLVDFAKKEDTFLFTEFTEVDAARNRIAAEIVSKYENDFNSFLVSLQAQEGVDKSIVESLLQTKIHVGELN
jgi:hypothetical protein